MLKVYFSNLQRRVSILSIKNLVMKLLIPELYRYEICSSTEMKMIHTVEITTNNSLREHYVSADILQNISQNTIQCHYLCSTVKY